MGKINKKWVAGGEQDKFILKLIKDGRITKHTKPGFITKMYPNMFNGFTAQVIRNHLNELKRSNGLYLADGAGEMTDEEDEKEKESSDASNMEMAGCSTKLNFPDDLVNIRFTNYPILCEKFKDPKNQSEKVFLAVAMPGGAQNVRFDLNDEGTMVSVRFSWPTVLYDMTDLFKKELTENEIELYHPKILACNNGLEKVRSKVDIQPESKMEITLPIKVQTALNTWKKNGILRKDGCQILTAEFRGYVKEYNKTASDSAVTFVL